MVLPRSTEAAYVGLQSVLCSPGIMILEYVRELPKHRKHEDLDHGQWVKIIIFMLYIRSFVQ